MNRVVIAIGSNIRPQDHVPRAVEFVARLGRIVSESHWAETDPVGGPPGQPRFLNGAVLLEITMDRDELRARLREIEDALGRTRNDDKFAPRTIDLNIVAWNGAVVDPDVFQRDYLFQAVKEVCPEALSGARLGVGGPPGSPPTCRSAS